jgi:hypothetical protein
MALADEHQTLYGKIVGSERSLATVGIPAIGDLTEAGLVNSINYK